MIKPSHRAAFAAITAAVLVACGARSELSASDTDRDVFVAAPVDAPAAQDQLAPPDDGGQVGVRCPAPVHARQSDTVSLTASATSTLGLPLLYAWTLDLAPGAISTLPVPRDATSTQYTFVYGGEYVLRFTATDTLTHRQSCVVPAFADPAIALHCANDVSVYPGATITLTATAHSNFGRALTAEWSMRDGPSNTTTQPTAPDALETQATIDLPGDYEFGLQVQDSEGLADGCRTNVHADADLRVVCPADTIARPGAVVDLTAAATSRAGRPILYQWAIVARPYAAHGRIVAPRRASTSLTLDAEGDWTFRMTASTPGGSPVSCTTRALAPGR